jgi:hypothetical protein
MLLYAVASPRWVRGDGFTASPRAITRRSEEQCSIGFQPVFIHTIERYFLPAHKSWIKLRVSMWVVPGLYLFSVVSSAQRAAQIIERQDGYFRVD